MRKSNYNTPVTRRSNRPGSTILLLVIIFFCWKTAHLPTLQVRADELPQVSTQEFIYDPYPYEGKQIRLSGTMLKRNCLKLGRVYFFVSAYGPQSTGQTFLVISADKPFEGEQRIDELLVEPWVPFMSGPTGGLVILKALRPMN